ncbi:MAG: fluoride efflux transporter CrcB [Pseudomonadales bacterium]|nr:fluoride efflux transporter CrcB [Pseudomonadales bacterium]
MLQLIAIALGGAVGSVARFLAANAAAEQFGTRFPYGTLMVNLVGSFLIGLMYVLIVEKFKLSAEIRGLVMVGFLGAFTTFSTFSLELLDMLKSGALLGAGFYISVSVIIGVINVWLGMQLGKNLF